jgi:hypothetical protein
MAFVTKAFTLLILCLALSMTSATNMRFLAESDERSLQGAGSVIGKGYGPPPPNSYGEPGNTYSGGRY